MNNIDMPEKITRRLYVGGLSKDITDKELSDRFCRFGEVKNLTLKTRTDGEGNTLKVFAHLDLEGSEADIKKCFSAYQNTKWKGSMLKIQYAKESFLNKLQNEREAEIEASGIEEEKNEEVQDMSFLELKGSAVPGTPVPGKKDWTVGKYGRVLPVLNMKKSYVNKAVKYDPAKHCHALKKFKEESKGEEGELNTCNELTWTLDVTDTEITKKRKGEFPFSATEKKVKMVENGTKMIRAYSQNTPSGQHNSSPESELEIVEVGANSQIRKSSEQKSNKFDSDVGSESDEETPAKVGKSSTFKDKSKSGKDKMCFTTKDKLTLGSQANKIEFDHTNKPDNKMKKRDMLFPENHIFAEQKEHANVETASRTMKQVENKNVNENVMKWSTTKTVESGLKQANPVCGKIPKFCGLSMLTDYSLNTELDTETYCSSSKSPLKAAPQKDLHPDLNTGPVHEETNVSPKLRGEKQRKRSADTFEFDSSAGTDESILQHKQKKLKKKKSTGVPASTSTKLAEKGSTDQALILSEYAAGDPDLDTCSLSPSQSPIESSTLASSDCDLDSNEFKVVAKKLAAKVKSTPVQVEAERIADVEPSPGKPVIKDKTPKERRKEKKLQTAEIKKMSLYSDEAEVSLKEDAKELCVKADVVKNSANVAKTLSSRRTLKTAVRQNKDSDANEKRLATLKEKMKMKEAQKAVIQNALKNVDSLRRNRIVFSSSDEDEEKVSDDDFEKFSSHKKNSQNLTESENRSKSACEKKLQLLENSSDEEDEQDLEEMFKSKPHFEGKKGEKLMKMEKRFGDSRFKVDSKFVDSESEEEEAEANDDTEEKPSALVEEKAMSLQVLENVVGKRTLDKFSDKIKRNTKRLIDINSVRFDPTKIEKKESIPQEVKKVYALSVEKTKVLASKGEKTDKEQKVATAAVQSVSKSQPKLADSLANLFKPKESQTLDSASFSLLDQFGGVDEEDQGIVEDGRPVDDSSKDKVSSTSVPATKSLNCSVSPSSKSSSLPFTRKHAGLRSVTAKSVNVCKSDDDDDDDDSSEVEDDNIIDNEETILEEEESDSGQGKEDSSQDNSVGCVDEPIDTEVSELREAGKVDLRYTKEAWLQHWEEIRPVLVKLYKRKHKDALKNKRAKDEQNRKKEFLRNSRKRFWNKRHK